MKKFNLLHFFLILNFALQAQEAPIYLTQTVDVKDYQNSNFSISGKLYIEHKAKDAGAIPIAIITKQNSILKSFIDKYGMETFKSGEWNDISISGKIDKQADKISIGAMLSGKGAYYFDDFKLSIRKDGSNIEIPLINKGFENDSIKPWFVSNFKDASKIKITTDKFNSGKHALLIDNSEAVSERYGNNDKIGKYANINGIKLYYEIYGTGEPLLLISGNNESIASFDKQIPEFSKKYTVIAVDSRGQGNSTADSTTLTYELFSDDVNGLLEFLNLKNVNVLGWSDGANIALILAMRHPDKVKAVASMAGVLYNNNSSIPENINSLVKKQLSDLEQKGISKTDINYRLKELLLKEPNINPDSLTKIKIPVLVMAGENDIVKKKHTELIAQKISKSTLKIFKKAGHEAPREIPNEFNKTVSDFFEKNK